MANSYCHNVSDFWQYFEPVRQFMPQNCSADVQAVISQIDTVFTSGSQSAIDAIKSNFGLSDIAHLDDVAGACERRFSGLSCT